MFPRKSRSGDSWNVPGRSEEALEVLGRRHSRAGTLGRLSRCLRKNDSKHGVGVRAMGGRTCRQQVVHAPGCGVDNRGCADKPGPGVPEVERQGAQRIGGSEKTAPKGVAFPAVGAALAEISEGHCRRSVSRGGESATLLAGSNPCFEISSASSS